MDQLLKVTNIKSEPTESTSIDRVEISSEMQMESVKQESVCLVGSSIYIKTEPQDDERQVPIIEDTSYEMCSHDNIKFTMIKIVSEEPEEDIMQDPLNVSDEIKVEERFPINLDQGEPRIKTEPTKKEKDVHLYKQLSIRSDTNRTVKEYICIECNRRFGRKSHLDSHFRIHTGKTLLPCDICKKLFNEKCNLARHMLIHSGEKPHMCDVCKKSFRGKSDLNKHKLIHSGEKPFSCDVCYKSFTTKTNLGTHRRLHTGDKPFVCDLCNKPFRHKSALTQHRRLHTEENPYSCHICNKYFTTQSNLNNHKKLHKN